MKLMFSRLIKALLAGTFFFALFKRSEQSKQDSKAPVSSGQNQKKSVSFVPNEDESVDVHGNFSDDSDDVIRSPG